MEWSLRHKQLEKWVALGTLGVGREDEAMRWRRSHQIGDSADRGISESWRRTKCSDV